MEAGRDRGKTLVEAEGMVLERIPLQTSESPRQDIAGAFDSAQGFELAPEVGQKREGEAIPGPVQAPQSQLIKSSFCSSSSSFFRSIGLMT